MYSDFCPKMVEDIILSKMQWCFIIIYIFYICNNKKSLNWSEYEQALEALSFEI